MEYSTLVFILNAAFKCATKWVQTNDQVNFSFKMCTTEHTKFVLNFSINKGRINFKLQILYD